MAAIRNVSQFLRVCEKLIKAKKNYIFVFVVVLGMWEFFDACLYVCSEKIKGKFFGMFTLLGFNTEQRISGEL